MRWKDIEVDASAPQVSEGPCIKKSDEWPSADFLVRLGICGTENVYAGRFWCIHFSTSQKLTFWETQLDPIPSRGQGTLLNSQRRSDYIY